MTKDVLNRAKDLEKDIESIRSLTEDYEKGDGLHISSSFPLQLRAVAPIPKRVV